MNQDYVIHKILSLLIIVIFILSSCTTDQSTKRLADYRIISLSPHMTEIIFELGAGDDLIAVTDFCSYPDEAMSKEKIGGLLNPNIEKIVALQPTHVFGVPAHADLARALSQFHITVTMMPNETILDFLNAVEKVGELIDRESRAKDIAHIFNDSLQTFSTPPLGDSVSAVLVIGRESGSLRNITVAGKSTFISELWGKAGGVNIYNDLSTHYASISIETLLLRNPQIIIELSTADSAGIHRFDEGTAWHTLQNISAVQMDRVYKISGKHTLIPGPRMLHLARDFAHIIKTVRDEERLYSDIYR